MHAWSSRAGRTAATLLVFAFLATLFGCPQAVIIPNHPCPFGNNWIQVVSFNLIGSEEVIRSNYTFNGVSGVAEHQQHMDSLEFWQMQANRVGINTTQTTYCVNMTFVNIGSTPSSGFNDFLRLTVREWTLKTNPINHFYIAPFGSALALPVMQELDYQGKIALSPSASSPALYQCSPDALLPQPECATKAQTAKRFEKAFGLQPPASRAAIPFMAITQLAGAKTVGFYVENNPFSQALVQGARDELSTYGMSEKVTAVLAANASTADYSKAMATLREANPDVIIGGTPGSASCKALIAQFSIQGWVPKGALFSLCSSDPLASIRYPNSKYFVDYVEWDRRLVGGEYVDKFYFPPNTLSSPMQMSNAFVANFPAYKNTPSSFGTCFAAGVVIHTAVQTLNAVTDDMADTVDQTIRTISVYSGAGAIAFSQWGQNSAREVAATQLDRNYQDFVIYPLGSVTKTMIIPMPTWEERVQTLSYMSSTLDIVFASIAAGLIAISIILAGFVWKFRERKILLAASPLFLIIMLVGTILMYLTIFAWLEESQTVACHMRFWLLAMGYVICFGALFAKTFRVMRIFGSKSLTVFRISNGQLLLGLAALVLVEAILLAIWSGTSRPTSYVYVVDIDRPILNQWRCRSQTNDKVMTGLLLAYNFGLALAAVWVSYRVWSIKAKMYNESRAIGFAMYNMLCFGILGVALQLSNALNPRAMFVVRSAIILLSTFVTVVVLFGPKISHLVRTSGRDYATSTQTTNTTAMTRSGSGPHGRIDKGASAINVNGSANGNSRGASSIGSSADSQDIYYWRGRYDDINAKYKKVRREKQRLEKEIAILREGNF